MHNWRKADHLSRMQHDQLTGKMPLQMRAVQQTKGQHVHSISALRASFSSLFAVLSLLNVKLHIWQTARSLAMRAA